MVLLSGGVIATGIGAIAVLGGIYQFYNSSLGGFRDRGYIESGSEVGEGEAFFGKLVGVTLIVLGIFFLWLAGIVPLAWLFNAL